MNASVLSRFLHGAAKAGGVKVAAIGFSFLFFLVLARNMSPAQYGVFAAAFSMATIAGFAATIGQHKAILRFWPALDEAHGAGAAAYMLRRALLTALAGAGVVVLLFAGLSASGLPLSAFGNDSQVVLLIGAFAATLALSDFTMAALRARGRIATALLPREVIWRVLVVAIVYVSATAYAASSALVLAASILAAIAFLQLLVLVRVIMQADIQRPPDNDLRAIHRATPGFWGISIAGPLMQQGATLAVAFTLGPVAAGAYFAAERLARLLSFALIGTNVVTAPMLSRSWKGGRMEEVQTVVSAAAVLGAVFALCGLLAYAILGRFALSLFDPTYREAWHALMVLGVAHLVNAACGPNGVLLNMTGNERVQLLIMSVWGVASIGLAWIGALELGLLGAALGTAIAIIGWNLTSVLACKRLTGINTFSIDAFRQGARMVTSGKLSVSGLKAATARGSDD